MKVYYEKPTGRELLDSVIELGAKYEKLTGKTPNRISMKQEELDAILDYLTPFLVKHGGEYKNQIYGMEIIIED